MQLKAKSESSLSWFSFKRCHRAGSTWGKPGVKLRRPTEEKLFVCRPEVVSPAIVAGSASEEEQTVVARAGEGVGREHVEARVKDLCGSVDVGAGVGLAAGAQVAVETKAGKV